MGKLSKKAVESVGLLNAATSYEKLRTRNPETPPERPPSPVAPVGETKGRIDNSLFSARKAASTSVTCMYCYRVYDKLMVIVTEHFIASPWVEEEVEAALEKERKTAPFDFPFSLFNLW